jgi:5'-3' exonuclease
MGIESFGGYVGRAFKPCQSEKKPDNIKSLFIDANTVFYSAARFIFPPDAEEKEKERIRKKDQGVLEDKLADKVAEILLSIIDKIKPSDNLIIAVDGLVNVAKLNQQKYRRYGKKEPGELFNTHNFTPGTKIMKKIDQTIEKMIVKIDNIKKVIYSSYLTPGEGEHKIFDLIRANQIIMSQGNHILYGDDSDLFIISLLSSFPNIYVFRDNKDISIFHNITKFKELVRKYMNTEAEEQIIYQDFALLTFFIGNDFLPRFPNLPNTFNTMNLMVKVYNNIKRNLTDLEGNIIWENFYHLINCLDKYKMNNYSLYENIAYNIGNRKTGWRFKYPLPILYDSIDLIDVKGRKVKEVYDSSQHTIKFDLGKFANLWYNKQFEPKGKKLKEKYDNQEYFTTQDIVKMVIKFLQTFQWVLKYYLMGGEKVPNSFFYPYKITPLTISVINYLKLLVREKKTKNLNKVMEQKNYPTHIIHQLLSVLPPSSLYLIPSEYHTIYKTALAAISPLEFPDPRPEGTDSEWTKKPNIPPVNLPLVINATRKIKLADEFKMKANLVVINDIEEDIIENSEDYKIKETILL